MHDVILGFVCFAAGVIFVVVVGFLSLGPRPLTDLPSAEARREPPREPARRPRREPEPHPAWPDCDCPSEAFHAKYHPAAGVQSEGAER
jgi:hypothetical protein